jgi:hypothetical protein
VAAKSKSMMVRSVLRNAAIFKAAVAINCNGDGDVLERPQQRTTP